MKKLLLTFFTLIIMLLLTALTVPFFIPLEEYKKAALSFVQEKTGHKVTIAGEMSLTLLPQVTLVLQGVQVDNPGGGFAAPYLAKMEKLELAVEPWPLLSKQVKISALTLVAPDIWLEENRAGQANWQMVSSQKASAGEASGGGAAPKFSYNINQFSLKNAQIYALIKGRKVEAKNLQAAWEYGQARLQGQVREGNNDWEVGLQLRDPMAWWQGGKSAVELTLQQPEAQLALDGTLTAKKFSGKLQLAVSSLAAMGRSLNPDSHWPEEPLKLESMQAELTPESAILAPMELSYADKTTQGALRLDWKGKVPKVTGELHLAEYVLAKQEGGDAAQPVTEKQASREWDDTPVDLSFLNKAAVQLKLTLDRLVTDAAELQDIQAEISSNGQGSANLTLTQAKLWGGTAQGALQLNATGEWQCRAALQEIAAEDALQSVTPVSRLSGKMSAKMDITSQGRSLRGWMRHLQGTGEVMLPEGHIEGFALPKLFRNLMPENGAAESTSNAQIAVTFRADQGVLTVQEGRLRAKEMLAELSGKVDMGGKHVDLRLKPSLAPVFTQQEKSAGLMVPLKIVGRFENIVLRPDPKGAVVDALQNPEQAKENIRILKEEGKAVARGLQDRKRDIKDEWKDLKTQKSPEALGKLLNTLDQSGVALPKVLDVFKQSPQEKQDTAGSVDGGAGAGNQPDAGASPDSGREGAGQQPPAADQSGAPATP